MKRSLPYEKFALIYNEVMRHVDFENWAEFILNSTYTKCLPKSILDLGCGTGQLLDCFPYSIEKKIGLDSSEQMLEIARINYPQNQYILGDFKNFSLKQKFDLIVCTHDCINYLIEEEDLLAHFFSVKKSLKKNGFYFFDASSETNLVENFDGRIFQETFNEINMTWRNKYYKNTKIIKSELFFVDEESNSHSGYKETHIQKYHTVHFLKDIISRSGLKLLKIGVDYKEWEYKENCSLINFLIKKL